MKFLFKQVSVEISQSIEDFAAKTINQSAKRSNDIRRHKIFAVSSFFSLITKRPEQITTTDVLTWHQWMLTKGRIIRQSSKNGEIRIIKKGLEESTIYTRFSHLSAYFQWLQKMPQYAAFTKTNPVRSVMPKPPKKYSSGKAKSLTNKEFSNLRFHLEKLAKDHNNLFAVRDYAIFTIFAATGMRTEEVLGLTANDLKFSSQVLQLRVKTNDSNEEWRTITDPRIIKALENYLILSKRLSTLGKNNRALWVRFDKGANAAHFDKAGNRKKSEPGLTSRGFEKQIKKYAHDVGIGQFNLHQLRQTFIRMQMEESIILHNDPKPLGEQDKQAAQSNYNQIQVQKDRFSQMIRRRIQLIETKEGQSSEDL